jgi:hypothetical protein
LLAIRVTRQPRGRCTNRGLAIFRELGDRWDIAGTLADLGTLAREEGNYSTACSLYRESIKIFQELDHKRGIARLLECFACSAAKFNSKQAVRCGWRAQRLRCDKIFALR